MVSSVIRQKKFRDQMEAAGYVFVCGWVHGEQASDVKTAMAQLRANSDLEVGPLRNMHTGEFVSRNKG